jgi:hypothetical protein
VEHAIRHQATRPVRRVRRDPGQEAGLMEPFTLLMMGPGLEETQIENMSRGDCIDRLLTIQGDRDLTKGQCIGPVAPSCPRTGRFRFAVLPAFPAAGCCQNASA